MMAAGIILDVCAKRPNIKIADIAIRCNACQVAMQKSRHMTWQILTGRSQVSAGLADEEVGRSIRCDFQASSGEVHIVHGPSDRCLGARDYFELPCRHGWPSLLGPTAFARAQMSRDAVVSHGHACKRGLGSRETSSTLQYIARVQRWCICVRPYPLLNLLAQNCHSPI